MPKQPCLAPAITSWEITMVLGSGHEAIWVPMAIVQRGPRHHHGCRNSNQVHGSRAHTHFNIT